jgi:hypothetical protein
MTAFETEFPFELPRGYVAAEGDLHREGAMRLATAADEILPLKDPRVQVNPAYLVVILLSRVVTRLGSLDAVTPKVIEGLFASDIAHLQDLYNRINGTGTDLVRLVCPHCERAFDAEPDRLGGSSATPSANSSRR